MGMRRNEWMRKREKKRKEKKRISVYVGFVCQL